MISGPQTFGRQNTPIPSGRKLLCVLMVTCVVTWITGCSQQRKQSLQFTSDCNPCQSMLQQIEYPDLECDQGTDGTELLTGPPMTISTFQELVPWELTVEQCVELALANSKVLQKLGGVVVNSPQGTTTLYDQAIVETGQGSVESALSAFDAQLNSSFVYNRNESFVNNPLFGAGVTNSSNFRYDLNKQTASGASFAIRNLTDYTRRPNPFTTLDSVYDVVHQFEVRQPLGRGRGTEINRIAGPNATPGNYNGVLIARIRSDISLTDFEIAVRNLVRDVESTYWELYFSYRDLDTKISARESARVTWENRKLRYENGVGRPDDEALARQQYFSFQSQAQNALVGVVNGQPGVLGSDRNLRRLMGMLSSDGRIIRPISDPALAPVQFDWDQSQFDALGRRAELRRQKWTVRQRELELVASKALNQWRFDFVGQYGFRGFGDKLLGAGSTPGGGAWNDSIKGNLDDWQVGVELGGAIGNRIGHLAIRNAELNLVRDRTILKEQQRQILLDLNQAFTEVDRALANLKTNFDSRVAAQEELEPKRKRVNEGQDQVFFLIDAEQRSAASESAVHRSVADYNKALLNYAYTTGTLLSRYNIRLSEGEWSEGARTNAIKRAPRFSRTGPNTENRDTSPVSLGVYDQAAPRIGNDANRRVMDSSTAPADPNLPIDQPLEPQPQLNRGVPAASDDDFDAEGSSNFSASSGFSLGAPSTAVRKYFESRAKRRFN